MRILVLLMFFLFLFPGVAFAAFSFQIESVNPPAISSKEETVLVTLSISDLPSESYFRVAWQEGEGKPYFGYVQNDNGDWIKVKSLSGDCREYFKVSDTETTSIILSTKIGEDSEINSGTYYLKAHRFTSTSCSVSNIVPSTTITVSFPTPTVTLTQTPTSTPSPTASPSPTTTSAPTPTPSKAPTPTVQTTKPTLATSPADIKRSDLLTPTASVASEILGASVSATPTEAETPPTVEIQTIGKESPHTDTFTAIAVGITSIGLLGVIFYRLSKISIKERIK